MFNPTAEQSRKHMIFRHKCLYIKYGLMQWLISLFLVLFFFFYEHQNYTAFLKLGMAEYKWQYPM